MDRLAGVIAPITAVVLFATGDSTSGWIAVAIFVGALYGALLALELVRRPWTHGDP